MRRMMFLASLASALVVGALGPAGASSAVGGSNLPVKGSGSGTFTYNPLTAQGDIAGSGEMTHLGRVTFNENSQYVFTSPTTFIGYFTSTLTAANGDQLFMTGVANGVLTDGTHATETGDWTLTSGTGRFMDASLTASPTIHVTFTSPVGGVWTLTLVGKLSWGK
jgi:hypothetical protein